MTKGRKRKAHRRRTPIFEMSGCIGAAAFLLVGILVRCISGSPMPVWLLMRRCCIMPPFLILQLMLCAVTCFMGYACGMVLMSQKRRCEREIYGGGMLCVLLAVVWFLTYPLVFRAGFFLLSSIFLLFCIALTFLCALAFARVRRMAGLLMLLVLLVQVYFWIIAFLCIISF